ncbi:MAG: GNAT family N-acetyltransferase [Phenylobacterium sp.]|uniref:GNAT family N-acetyltransferase n=1 Tax=Phenylobacterium sp. TaxID=1871053 RepID=UPI0039199B72
MGSDAGAARVRVREAGASDLPGVLAIYNQAILETTAVWSNAPVDLNNRREWLKDRQVRGFPVLVAEADGAVCGFASFGEFRAWPGYVHTVEHSVYVAQDWRRHGVGRALLEELIEAAKTLQKHVLIAGIEAENSASLKLHAALGFEHAGRLHQVGAKFGRWLDLVFMELRLDSRPAPA